MSQAGYRGDATGRLLAELIDAVDDVLYVIDEGGDLVLWNEALVERTGYAEDEIAEMDPSEFLRPEQQSYTPGAGTPIAELPDRQLVVDIRTKDGEAIPHEFRGTTVEDAETGEAFRIGIARDVSDRLERARELERYETIIESLSDGVYALDEDLRLAFVNDGLCEMLGRSRDELLGADPRGFILEEEQLERAAKLRERAIEGEVTTATFEATTATQEGERIDVETRYQLLHEPEEGGFPGSAGVIRDVTERNRRERELREARALLEGILNSIPDAVFAFDPEGEPLAEEFLLEEFAGYTAAEMAEMGPLDFLPESAHDEVAALIAEVLETGAVASTEVDIVAKDGTRIPYEFRGTRLTDEDGEVLGIVGSGRDITERLERERELERRRDELESLNRINELVLGVTRELLETPSRRALERAVCDRLAESDLYRGAWIGEPEVDGDGTVVTEAAGRDAGSGAPGSETPAARALETGEVAVALPDDGGDGPATAAVPLVHGETVYGVLGVSTDRPDAFGERERAGLGILGETVGFVVNAVKRRKLLFAEAVTELEFEVAGERALLAGASAAFDCDLEMSGYVDAGDRWLVYLEVDGADLLAVAEELAGAASVEEARVIADGSERGRLEIVLGAWEPLDAASAVGATLASASASDGRGRIVLEVPVDGPVREAVDLVTARLPGATLVAQRERDRPAAHPGTPDGLLDELTERQREVLSVAYRAGYYEWPRESTAEEVAETLEVAPPTLHGHLRKAEGTVLAELLDGEPSPE